MGSVSAVWRLKQLYSRMVKRENRFAKYPGADSLFNPRWVKFIDHFVQLAGRAGCKRQAGSEIFIEQGGQAIGNVDRRLAVGKHAFEFVKSETYLPVKTVDSHQWPTQIVSQLYFGRPPRYFR